MVIIANFLKIIFALFIPFFFFCIFLLPEWKYSIYDFSYRYLIISKKTWKPIVHHADLVLYSVGSKLKLFVLLLLSFIAVGGNEHTGQKSFMFSGFFSLDMGCWSLLSDRTKSTNSCSQILNMCDLSQKIFIAVFYSWFICFFFQFPIIFFWWSVYLQNRCCLWRVFHTGDFDTCLSLKELFQYL